MKEETKKNRKWVLLIILMALLAVAYKVVFVSSVDETLIIDDNSSSADKINTIKQQIDSISFDTSILNDQKFNSLKSIDNPLPSLPVGKSNPFK